MTVECAKKRRKGKQNTRRKKQFNKLLTEQKPFARDEISCYKTNAMKTGPSLHDDVMTKDDISEHLSTPKMQNKNVQSKSSKRNKEKTKQNDKD